MTPLEQHAASIMAVAHGPAMASLPTTNTGLIHRSWTRCVNDFGLDPVRPPRPYIETASALRMRRERIEEHLQVARAGMEQLFKCVSALGYVLLLTDANGVTLDYIGNDTWDERLKHAGLHLGANWAEAFAGTNGVGTCVAERRPITCHREEHFYISNANLSCNAVPLFGPDGAFLGVLNVSLLAAPDATDSSHLAHRLTILYGQMIEDTLFLRHFHDQAILRLGNSTVHIAGEPMLAFDGDGVIVGANTSARQQLQRGGGMPGALVGRTLPEVLRCTVEKILQLSHTLGPMDRVPLDTLDHRAYSASLIVPQRPRAMARRVVEADVPSAYPALDQLADGDANMLRILGEAKRLVNKPVNILIQGETGTGKEVFAKALHESSNRAGKPFIAVNCAAFPESLIESELFGYAAGAFTGARTKGMRGLIAQSDGGTLFLDEIGDMPLALQTRLLRVLSEQEIVPLGAEKPIAVRLSVIAASHRDLRQQIASGTFREDLYYRLCGATIPLPPLRERSDKAFLIRRIVGEEAASMEAGVSIDEAAMSILLRYNWPGNVRQLRNVLRYALAISGGQGIAAAHLPSDLRAAPAPAPHVLAAAVPDGDDGDALGEGSARDRACTDLLRVLRKHKWNITAVATELELSRTTIYRQMRRYRIVDPRM
jgi:transcriptional regulator of acetoin/glycerol metabolism